MNFKKKKKKTYTSIYVSRFKGFATYLSTMRTKMCASQTWNILKKKKVIVSVKTIVGLTKILLLLKRRTTEGKMLCKYSLHRITT